jgi:mutator family transposase
MSRSMSAAITGARSSATSTTAMPPGKAEEVCSDHRRVDEQVSQVPAVVRESPDDSLQPGNVALEPLGRVVDADVGSDEVAQFSEAVLVAAAVVSAIEALELLWPRCSVPSPPAPSSCRPAASRPQPRCADQRHERASRATSGRVGYRRSAAERDGRSEDQSIGLRNSFRYAARQDWDKIARDLKPVYTAPTEAAAAARFEEFAESWGTRYPAIVKLWRTAWSEFTPFLDYDVEIRRIICTTNAIESLNARYRRAVRARGHFPTEQAALKCLYLLTRSLDPTGRGTARWVIRWKAALNAFAITFEGRLAPSTTN